MTLEEIKRELETNVPGCQVEILANGSPSAQNSLLIDCSHAPASAKFLREHPRLQLDFCSNVTAVDWPDQEKIVKIKTKKVVEGVEREVEETQKTKIPGFLEVVYHLFSMKNKDGPVIIRMRTANRAERVTMPSLTPIWRSAEFQEREAFDLFGIVFEGHPDLRRILMWEGFTDYPMRKDYVAPQENELDTVTATELGA